MVVNEIVVSTETADVLVISGRVPLVFAPGSAEKVWVGCDEPMSLTARSSPNPAFWDQVADISRYKIMDPDLDLLLEGLMAAPTGTFRIKAGSVGLAESPQMGWEAVITGL